MDSKKQNQNLNEMKEGYLAIKHNELDKLSACIEKHGVDAPYDDGTLLHQAVFRNNIEAVQLLLDASADRNALYDNSTTALIAAIESKYWEIATLLIQSGADVNLQDAQHNTPLSKAIFFYEGDNRVLEMLICRGASPYADLLNGYTPMDLAKNMKLDRLLETIIDKYKNANGQ